jgi:hypothetical protein
MTVTLQLANQFPRLGRENLTVRQIATRLGLPEQAIIAVLTMPSDEERAARRAKVAKRWQYRISQGK